MEITSLADITRIHGEATPERCAFVFEGRSYTFGHLHARSSKVANGLQELGVQPGANVSYLGKNSIHFFELLFGLSKANASMAAINWRFAPREIRDTLNDAESQVLVVDHEYFADIEKVEGELSSVRKIFGIGGHDRFEEFDTWVEAQHEDDPRVPSSLEDGTIMLYTSGTTGRPKGVVLTNQSVPCMLSSYAERWGFTESSVYLSALPNFHGGGWWFALPTLLSGGHVILLREVDVAEIAESIPRHHVTHLCLVPAALQLLLEHPGIDRGTFASLDTFIYGGSPISEAVLRRAMEVLDCDFLQTYGTSEASVLTELRPEDHDLENRPHLLLSCGKPLPWVEVRIVDPQTGDDMAAGDVGEVWSRTLSAMWGYWKQPLETDKTIDSDGWVHTGDAGTFDEDGYIFLKDRVKDMIVSGGENVYPAEVENCLMKHADILDVAVIGVPHDRWGETLKALVVRRAGSEVTEAEIISFARESLAGFKCPTSVDFIDELPRNPSGKVLKYQLREPYWAGRERRVG